MYLRQIRRKAYPERLDPSLFKADIPLPGFGATPRKFAQNLAHL